MSIQEIPRDPYDISGSLARRLVRLDARIHLTSAEQATYAAAMRLSLEHGPCCCYCWRWTAFRGLSKDLIVRRRWPARRLGRLIGALDGCGGRA